MTAHQTFSVLDRVDLDRFDDDGGAPDRLSFTPSVPGTQPLVTLPDTAPEHVPEHAREVLRLAGAGSLTGSTDEILRTAGVASPP
ncbi:MULTISPECIES: hypothetical protein [unclassified Frankia]|uniref:hypothetical protein n=1 Tax=unclassified Frankia TaxID=2632575 RepID=UPI0020253FA1